MHLDHHKGTAEDCIDCMPAEGCHSTFDWQIVGTLALGWAQMMACLEALEGCCLPVLCHLCLEL